MRFRVLITCPPMLKRIDEFRPLFEDRGIDIVTPPVVQTLSEQELITMLPDFDAWIIGDDPATARVFEAGKQGKLRAAVKWGVGVDNVDLAACQRLGIPIANTPRMFGGEVADLAIGYLVGLARDSYRINDQVKRGNWIKPAGMSITGSTVGVVGLGDIGQAVIKRLKGFEVRIFGYDPFSSLPAGQLGIDSVRKFPDGLDQTDFLILTCALTESSRYLVNKTTLQAMKKGIRVINVARGPLIREADLVEFLHTGHVAAAALDVFEIEPLPADSPLRQFDQCIFGTHNGSNTIEAVRRASFMALDLLFGFLKVKP